jgi:glutamine synthetase
MVKVKAEYVWFDSRNNFRSKTRIFDTLWEDAMTLDRFPLWNYDGSSTGQVYYDKQSHHNHNSEIILEPYTFYHIDNFIIPDTYVIFCNSYIEDNDSKIYLSSRQQVLDVFNNAENLDCMFGFEQEFFILDSKTNLPIGFSYENKLIEHGEYIDSYYCGIGAGNIGKNIRKFMNRVMETLIKLDVGVTGMNYEVTPGQAEFQICNTGIKACDELILLRYILILIGEYYDFRISFKPKLDNIPITYNGSGCHINFSTNNMRNNNGYDYIKKAVENLAVGADNMDFIQSYGGEDNLIRLSGNNETSNYKVFSYGVGDRSASIRIPTNTFNDKKGYFEDRRPGANIDPYLASCYLIKKIL